MRGGTLLLLWKSFRIFRLFCLRQDAIIMLKFIAGGGDFYGAEKQQNCQQQPNY